MTDTPAVLITGAAQRIGAAIAHRFHVAGFHVLVHYRTSAAAAEALVASLNGQRAGSAATLAADLTRPADVAQLARQAVAVCGRLDVLVNNASTFYPTAFGASTQVQWDDLIDSNLRGAFFLSQALAEELKQRRGTIVNLIDTHADRPLAGHGIYSIAKAGLKSMTKALAGELAPLVRVNGVAPGAILWPARLEDDADPAVVTARQSILQQIPLGHLGSPEQIADAVFFLAVEASYVTGQVVRVDGGRHLA